jgi:hypothetical protein
MVTRLIEITLGIDKMTFCTNSWSFGSVARLRGFETDLELQGQQFPTLLSILYVGYIIMQIPSLE